MKAKLPRVYDFVVRKPFKSENDSFEKGKKFKAFVKSFVVKSNETGWIEMFRFVSDDDSFTPFETSRQNVKFATDEVEVKDN